MQPKSLVLLVLALGCGLVASIGITQVMSNRDSEENVNPDVEKIYVALQEISTGTPITVEMIKLEEWPKGKVEGPLSQLEDVEGRMPRTQIYPGEPILDKKLLSKGDSSAGADVQIPKGYRVVPVRVTEETGGAAMILPGNRVDVLILVKLKVQTSQARTHEQQITKTILQNIKVFAVDSTWSLQPSEDGKTIRAKTISLLLTPTQTEEVALASEVGKIFLALRSPEDDAVAELGEAVTLDSILEGMEVGDKQKDDNLVYEEEAEHQPQAENGFLEMLAAGPGDAAAELGTTRPTRSWVMKTIRGSRVEDVVLELEEEEQPPVELTQETQPKLEATEKPGSFSFWKIVTSPNPVSDTARDKPQPIPAAGEAEPERSGQEPSEQAEPEETVPVESS
jgi:pilus assembly protein CpaB